MAIATSFVIVLVTVFFAILAAFQFYLQANYNPCEGTIGGVSGGFCSDSDSGNYTKCITKEECMRG